MSKPQAYPSLIQFWAPIVIEGRCLLTTKNQPFALYGIDRGLCRYKMISNEYEFYVDGESEEDIGLPGRVFLHKFPESTPNVEFYSSKEYPQRDRALRCHVGQNLALPVFDRSGQSCVGVLELTNIEDSQSPYKNELNAFEALKEVGLKCLDVYEHFSKQDDARNESLAAAMDEIRKVLKAVCEATELLLAQAWVPCSLCTAIVDDGTVMSTIQSLSHYTDKTCKYFLEDCKSFHLRKGQGVVGRALLSQSLLFCTDVTQFSMAEYPLAHYARSYDLRGCFAICLQSSHLGNDVYVLEFFLPASTTGNLQASLRLILGAMNMFFQTSKLFSGEDLGEELPIEVIDFLNGEKLCYTLKPQTTGSLPPPEALQNRAEMMQPDPLDQQPMDAINNERNVASGEQCDIAVTSSQEKGKLKTLERPQSKTGFQISLKDLQQHAGMKLKDVAKRLQVSRSTLKRVCREYDIPSWPPRKLKKDNFSLPVESVHGVDREKILQSSCDLPSKHTLATVTHRQHRKPRGSTMQDANIVTIKARYVDDNTIKFPLSLSSGLVDLQQEVAKRLNLKDGTYSIKYKDEDNDLILIACDEDLQH